MADSIDENAGVTPGEDPADAASTEELPATEALADGQAAAAEAPTVAQTAVAAAAAAPATSGPKQSWFRKRWVLITGAVVAGVILLLGGVAIGTTIGDHNGRDGHRGMDGPGQFRQDGNGFGPQADGQGHGGVDRDGDGGFGHGGSRDGDQYGQPQQGAPQPYGTPQPQGTPQGQSATPQVQ
jgi:hypothetical protein